MHKTGPYTNSKAGVSKFVKLIIMHKTGPFTNSGVSKFVKLVAVYTKRTPATK